MRGGGGGGRGGAVGEEDQLDTEQAKKVMRRAWGRLRPYRKLVVTGGLLSVLWTGTIVAGPFLVRYGIDKGLRNEDEGALNIAIACFLGVTALSYVTYRTLIIAVNQVGERFLRDLRVQVFDHLQALSMSFYDREKAGVVISRMTADVESLSELVQVGLISFVSNALLLVITVVVLFVLSWQLALVCLIGLPIVVIASIKFQRDSNKAYLTVRDRIGQTLTSLQEGLSGVRVIQAFGREDVEVGRFGRRNRGLYDAHMHSVKISVWYFPIVELSGIAGTAAVIGIGGMFVRDDVITIGTVAAFVLLLANLFEPVQQLSQLFNTLQSAGAALSKLFGVLDTKIELAEHPGAVDLPRKGEIVVDHVWFSYAGSSAPVLRDVSLTIAPGERLALVGPTGAGKSTLAKLGARLYDPTEGSISYGGIDLRHATLSSLRARMVVVPQEGFLFNGTLADNVRIGRGDATDDEVAEALRNVGALDRFATLPGGLQMPVNARGTRLSAGEKQLVSLARAALADPDVLVLDEATSSLDPGTEVLVEAAIERLMEGRTVVVIAHRLSTSERADRVGVVVGGELVELGPHDELVEQGGHYAALFASWAGGLARR